MTASRTAIPYARLVAAPVVDETPEMFVLGSSRYGPSFAAVNGMSAVFAHHMSPDLAFESLRRYRREFRPRTDGARPYSAMSILTFASDDEEAVARVRGGVDADDAQPRPRRPRAAAA